MFNMKRLYLSVVLQHFKENDQMLFLVGPRQVGKTTIAKQAQQYFKESIYLSWDVVANRTMMIGNQSFIEDILPIKKARDQKPLVIFDEIHKYIDWKNWLKGFFDLYKDHYHILVTGSARLDIFKAGSDSLMGRYFLCRIHPISVAEIINPELPSQDTSKQSKVEQGSWDVLYTYGGFPQPFMKHNKAFCTKWRGLRKQQLFYDDIATMANVQELGQIEVLGDILRYQTGQLLNRTSLSKKVQVSIPTIARWLKTLERFYYCFSVKPWHKNISRSLIKEPKVYLWDWSDISDPGMRYENFVACHLQKMVHLYNDLGLGYYDLYFLRNKDQREVDFLVSRDNKPWMIIEAKYSDNNSLSRNLEYFQGQSKSLYSFQVVYNIPYVDKSCFDFRDPIIVSAQTFLSQLV